MPFYRISFSVLLTCLATSAFAQAEYNAADVVGHFKNAETAVSPACSEGAACLPKGRDRAVCIGTGSACADKQAATAAPPAAGGFDLLITFELGSDRLSRQAQANLREFAIAMSDPSLQGATFDVDGHTDARGSDDFNAALSHRRAQAVIDFLKALGVEESRLRANGFGESKPRVDDPFAAINRRVEATIRTQ